VRSAGASWCLERLFGEGVRGVVIWFAVASILLVAVVFKSPGVDYRVVVAGSLLPLVEAVLGGPRALHSVLGAVALLVVVVALTQRRRLWRRRLLGMPIGLMTHLVLDGSFARPEVFWWPLASSSVARGQIPELSHLGIALVLEAAGVGVAVWAWRWFRLDDAANLRRFLVEGRLDPPADPRR